MKKRLLIYGAGGLGREVLSLVTSLPEWEAIGFIDDQKAANTVVDGLKIIGDWHYLENSEEEVNVVLALGNPVIKKQLIGTLTNKKILFPSLVDPSAIIQSPSTVTLGEGVIICAGSILTTSIVIGNHVLINLKATIGHDVMVGNFSSIMPGVNVAGEVSVGSSVLIGSGANVINGITIGNGSTIGMGAVVLNDVSEGATVVGVPARQIKR
jgi:sugar O-acyltransferase (sialic acid O-acetyltransferase NeuD family)